jgi:hypothetical protein
MFMVRINMIEKTEIKLYLPLGIDNEKYYVLKMAQGGTSAGTISQANDETDYEKREKVYEQNRVELSVQFRWVWFSFSCPSE